MIKTTAPGSGFLRSLQIGLIAATLLASCLSAPTPAEPWWYHPCNTEVAKFRHGRSTTDHLVLVKGQLRVFIGQLNSSIKKINVLYKGQVSKAKTPYGKFKWLPLKKTLKNFKKSPSDVLPEFYRSLHRFASTLDVLKNIKIKSGVKFDSEERHSIYQNITYQMRSLLCEVQYTLENDNKKVPPGITIKKKSMGLPENFDLTSAHIIDLNFFKKIKSFFSKTQKILGNKKKSVKKLKKGVTSEVQKKRT